MKTPIKIFICCALSSYVGFQYGQHYRVESIKPAIVDETSTINRGLVANVNQELNATHPRETKNSEHHSASNTEIQKLREEITTLKNLLAVEQTENRSANDWETIKSVNGNLAELEKIYEAEFNQEETNMVWASDNEQAISLLFQNEKELEGLALKGVICKSTRCQVSVATNGIESLGDITQRVMSTFNKNLNGAKIKSIPSISKNTATFYVNLDNR